MYFNLKTFALQSVYNIIVILLNLEWIFVLFCFTRSSSRATYHFRLFLELKKDISGRCLHHMMRCRALLKVWLPELNVKKSLHMLGYSNLVFAPFHLLASRYRMYHYSRDYNQYYSRQKRSWVFLTQLTTAKRTHFFFAKDLSCLLHFLQIFEKNNQSQFSRQKEIGNERVQSRRTTVRDVSYQTFFSLWFET